MFTRYQSMTALLTDQLGENLEGLSRKINKIIVHYTATPPPVNERSVFGILQGIHEYHKRQGWKGIGYHVVISPNGYFYDGRPINQSGAHCRGHNADSIGVALLCDEAYLRTEPLILYNALQTGLKEACSLLSIDRIAVFLHRQYNQTKCPPLPAVWVEKLHRAGFASISLGGDE